MTVSRMMDKSGKEIGIAKVGRDISERKRAERVQNLLIGELHHRVKNTLATIQAISNQTLKRSENLSEFSTSFTGRLRALADAHSLLTDNGWQSADLSILVHDQLMLGQEDDDRISVSGPTVALDPQAAIHFTLILHELGTNARKYGSLSVPAGHLSVQWSIQTSLHRRLNFQWEESDGPRVVTPLRSGFGTTLIEQSVLAHDGEITVEFGVNGLTCTISMPLVDQTGRHTGAYRSIPSMPASGSQSTTQSLQGKRILVVEDEPLVALDLASTLKEEGCHVVGPASSVETAKKLIADAEFDAALLDANLGGHRVDELAASLVRQNQPFAFVTGYGRGVLPEPFSTAPMIGKPYPPAQLLASLAKLLTRGENVVHLKRDAN
jgi:two-component sensor histidine kinase/CheY-like chemotaxis protein